MPDEDKPMVLFGIGSLADRVRHYVETWTARRVVAFTIDGQYLEKTIHGGLPVVPFEEIAQHFAPETYAFFACCGYRDRNRTRARVQTTAEALGYEVPALVSPLAVCSTAEIGAGTLICEGATLGPFCRIGRGVIVSAAALVSHDAEVEDFAYLAARSVAAGASRIGTRSMIGLSASVGDKVHLPPDSVLGAGSLMLKSPDRPGIYIGTPARYTRDWT